MKFKVTCSSNRMGRSFPYLNADERYVDNDEPYTGKPKNNPTWFGPGGKTNPTPDDLVEAADAYAGFVGEYM